MDSRSTFEILSIIGERLRGHRLQIGLTQAEVSERSGVSIPVIRKLENGEASNISFQTLLSIMRVYRLDIVLEDIVPECPPDPYVMSRYEGKERRRVRHGKNETV